MGYGVHRFITHVDQNLLCPICSATLEDAVLTPCGHSFCYLCLETWLLRSEGGTGTCPECRTMIRSNDSKPVLAIRNLINGMNITCENHDQGCSVVVKLDRLKAHLETCGYEPVNCNGCGVEVLRLELAGHQIGCSGLQDAVTDDSDNLTSPRSRMSVICCSQHSKLTCRVTSLELKLNRLKRDLDKAEAKNRYLERELKKTKDELQDKRNQIQEQQFSCFDPDYEYGFTPQTISRLSIFISKFLTRRPAYVDRNRIFHSIKRCYDNYSRGNGQYENDVNMLLATANASNWFTENQNMHFQHWLNCMTRLRQINLGLTTTSSSLVTCSSLSLS